MAGFFLSLLHERIDVIFCLDGFYLVFFRFGQHHLQVAADAFARELEQSLLSCPEVEELHRGVRCGIDEGLLAFVHGVAHQRGTDLSGYFHIRADGPVAEGTQGHRSRVTEAEVDVGMLRQIWFALRGVAKERWLQDAVLLFQTLHQEQIDRKAETAATLMTEP